MKLFLQKRHWHTGRFYYHGFDFKNWNLGNWSLWLTWKPKLPYGEKG